MVKDVFVVAHFTSVVSRRYAGFLADEPLTVRGVVRGVSPFAVLWNLSGYLYLLSLRHIAPGDACAVLCCSQAFHFLLAWIGLNHHFMGVRVRVGNVCVIVHPEILHPPLTTPGWACVPGLYS